MAWVGAAACVGFVVLRLSNVYGDPADWQAQESSLFTFLSFLNCQKYPPSLLFLLMTLGPALLFMALLEGEPGRVRGVLRTFGRVPLFYYVLHLYVLHLGAGVLYWIVHDRFFIFGDLFMSGPPTPYGFDLWVVYVAWTAGVALLYPACRWFADVKRRKRSWILSYL